MCISCGYVARKKICKLGDPCVAPGLAGLRNKLLFAQGKAPTNCAGWPYRKQFQKSFAFCKPPTNLSKLDTITIARVREQITAVARFETIQKRSIIDDPSSSADDLPTVTLPQPLAAPAANTLDDSDGDQYFPSDDEPMTEVPLAELLPEDWERQAGAAVVDSESD